VPPQYVQQVFRLARNIIISHALGDTEKSLCGRRHQAARSARHAPGLRAAPVQVAALAMGGVGGPVVRLWKGHGPGRCAYVERGMSIPLLGLIRSSRMF
jgi:hypothetical protein